MATGFVIRKNAYYDSVFLMRIAKMLDEEPGVDQSAAVMATEANKRLLGEIGIAGGDLERSGPNDLVVGVVAASLSTVEQLLGSLDERLQSLSGPTKPSRFHTIVEASISNPDSNLAVFSIPGEYATREARKALELGKHLFLFSSNVPLEQEIELKQAAQRRGLFVMGPDCGTSIIQGIGIGFANVVRRGPVGVVGASGTGLQEFTSLVHLAGSGISHAIGTGSRDLFDAVGGITTMMGLDALEDDPGTQVIAIISKPAGPNTLKRLLERIRRCRKPVIGYFPGMERNLNAPPFFKQAGDIDKAVELAISQLDRNSYLPKIKENDLKRLVEGEISSWQPQQRYLRGLFAGGTLCYQSQQVLVEEGIPVYSNSPFDKRYHLEDPENSLEHSLIDMGDEFFTRGKPHPMIDAGQRRKRILQEATDPEVAVLLVDFILGYVSSPDPAGDLVEEIHRAKKAATSRGGSLTVVASICGTELDPQGYDQQKEVLEQAGTLVFPTNAQAARFCAKLIIAAQGVSYGA